MTGFPLEFIETNSGISAAFPQTLSFNFPSRRYPVEAVSTLGIVNEGAISAAKLQTLTPASKESNFFFITCGSLLFFR